VQAANQKPRPQQLQLPFRQQMHCFYLLCITIYKMAQAEVFHQTILYFFHNGVARVNSQQIQDSTINFAIQLSECYPVGIGDSFSFSRFIIIFHHSRITNLN